MIKKMYRKKILISIVSLFTIFFIYIIPNNTINTVNSQIKEEKNKNNTIIYLLNKNNLLVKTSTYINEKDTIEKAKKIIDLLTIKNNYNYSLNPVIPKNAKLINISLDNGCLKLNFNNNIFNTDKIYEEKIVESLIYSLTSLNDVDNILIFANNKIVTKLPSSNIILPPKLDKSYGINKEYNITNYKNISKTTIYYLENIDDSYYYVPVTKINNDTRDKIEIIIEELKSYNTYNTNLISFLDYNTKLISSETNNDNIYLNFDNNITNNINNKELYDVIHSISYSIYDNYDINSIIFAINNKEIHKSNNKSIE